jgi:twitching motility protein PilI
VSQSVQTAMTDENRSGRLRQFQDRLAERLQKADVHPQAARLGLQIGETRLLVSLAQAGQILPVPRMITPVPLARDWLLGLVNLNGKLFAVSDLQRFLGGAGIRLTKESRLLAFGPALELDAALLVTRMLGLHETSAWVVSEHGAVDAEGFIGRTLVDPDGTTWQELDLAALAGDEKFLAAAR